MDAIMYFTDGIHFFCVDNEPSDSRKCNCLKLKEHLLAEQFFNFIMKALTIINRYYSKVF